ncbi:MULTISPECIES: hypothetical protein [Sphingomonas]|uniref:hypothetical protein n=1 Tax=Sphingomonas TaxID=13687 RepID=UPI00254B3301|nr:MULTISPECIES: hypothetical protein [Sphingomonas]MDK8186723.1 hypothetical protein [Sphingomonas zeae]MDK8216388.1 hypothetical protein [Sphingomonas sp. UMB7805-LC452B]
MKKIYFLVLLSACTPQGSQSNQSLNESSVPKALVFNGDYEQNNGKVTARVATNLPDGTELTARFSNGFGPESFQASDQAVVEKGKATFDTFSDRGAPLKPGRYDISITAPLSIIQPSNIQQAVGADYSKFYGPALKRRSSPKQLDGATISWEAFIYVK